jgi:hypothetical protein
VKTDQGRYFPDKISSENGPGSSPFLFLQAKAKEEHLFVPACEQPLLFWRSWAMLVFSPVKREVKRKRKRKEHVVARKESMATWISAAVRSSANRAQQARADLHLPLSYQVLYFACVPTPVTTATMQKAPLLRASTDRQQQTITLSVPCVSLWSTVPSASTCLSLRLCSSDNSQTRRRGCNFASLTSTRRYHTTGCCCLWTCS